MFAISLALASAPSALVAQSDSSRLFTTGWADIALGRAASGSPAGLLSAWAAGSRLAVGLRYAGMNTGRALWTPAITDFALVVGPIVRDQHGTISLGIGVDRIQREASWAGPGEAAITETGVALHASAVAHVSDYVGLGISYAVGRGRSSLFSATAVTLRLGRVR